MYFGPLALVLNTTTGGRDGNGSVLEDLNSCVFLWKCLLPITLGNAISGAVRTERGCKWYVSRMRLIRPLSRVLAVVVGAMGIDR